MTMFLFVASLLGVIALGVPIAIALLASGILLMIHMDVFESTIVAQYTIEGADSFPLLAIPFFMLAGETMNVGGLSRRIVNLAMALVGHVRGGLGYVAIFAAVVLASLSGSAVADTAAIATLLLPMMVQAGHAKPRAAGLICSAAMTAPIIPPSIPFVIFGVAANLSIGKLFLAGIVPGLILASAIALVWSQVARRENVTPLPRATWEQALHAFIDAVWALGLPFIIVFGLRFGWFTPTEAAVVAAVYALFVATVIYREVTLRQLYDVFLNAAQTSSIIMFLVAASMVSAWLITVAEVPAQFSAMLEPLLGSETLLKLAIMALLIVLGTMMDAAPIILVMTPILMPIVKTAGIDPYYFGVLLVVNVTIGLITPPVGSVLNVTAGVSRLRMEQVVGGVMPFLLAQFAVLLLLTVFPSLVIVPLRFLTGG
jgi:tripartite ATP-independent transporter DctM subunit